MDSNDKFFTFAPALPPKAFGKTGKEWAGVIWEICSNNAFLFEKVYSAREGEAKKRAIFDKLNNNIERV